MRKTGDNLTVAYALRKIDTPSILFFLGILLAVSALESTGATGACGLDESKLKDQNLIVIKYWVFVIRCG